VFLVILLKFYINGFGRCQLAFEIKSEEFLIILQRLYLPTRVGNLAGFISFNPNVEGYPKDDYRV